jgi:hypothetical protein
MGWYSDICSMDTAWESGTARRNAILVAVTAVLLITVGILVRKRRLWSQMAKARGAVIASMAAGTIVYIALHGGWDPTDIISFFPLIPLFPSHTIVRPTPLTIPSTPLNPSHPYDDGGDNGGGSNGNKQAWRTPVAIAGIVLGILGLLVFAKYLYGKDFGEDLGFMTTAPSPRRKTRPRTMITRPSTFTEMDFDRMETSRDPSKGYFGSDSPVRGKFSPITVRDPQFKPGVVRTTKRPTEFTLISDPGFILTDDVTVHESDDGSGVRYRGST